MSTGGQRSRRCRTGVLLAGLLLLVTSQAAFVADPAAAGAQSTGGTSPVVTSVAQCIGGGVAGVSQAVRPGRLSVTGGSGSFSGVTPGQLSVTATPGMMLSGQVDLEAENTGQSVDVAPLIGTPSWGDPASSYWTVQHSIPVGAGAYTASVNLTAPTRPGTYHVLFAFALEEHGYNVASATNWASGLPPQWGDGNNIAELTPSKIAQAQRYGCAVDRWNMQSGPQDVLVAVTAITIDVTPGAAPPAGTPAGGIRVSPWKAISTGNTPQTGAQLNAVTCVTDTDCWAVGSVSTGPTATSGEGPSATVAIHWDGKSWTRVTTPSPASPTGPEDALDTIACPAANDCWAGGWQGAGPGTNGSGMLLHWNGRRWTEEPDSALMEAIGPVVTLACASASECWAAGSNGPPSEGYLYLGGSVQSLLRYGSQHGRLAWFLATDARHLRPAVRIEGLTCGPNSGACWMVGAIPVPYTATPGLQRPGSDTFAAEYLPGSGWRQTPTSSPPFDYVAPQDQLTSVTCASDSSCWAVGDNPAGAASLESSFGETFLTDHWNGSTWSPETLPAPPATSSAGFANPSVACVSASDCWLLGSEWSVSPGQIYATAVPTYRVVAEHWNGRTWSEVPVTQPDSTGVHVASVACTVATCFAVGSYDGTFVPGTAGPPVHPLILRLAMSSQPSSSQPVTTPACSEGGSPTTATPTGSGTGGAQTLSSPESLDIVAFPFHVDGGPVSSYCVAAAVLTEGQTPTPVSGRVVILTIHRLLEAPLSVPLVTNTDGEASVVVCLSGPILSSRTSPCPSANSNPLGDLVVVTGGVAGDPSPLALVALTPLRHPSCPASLTNTAPQGSLQGLDGTVVSQGTCFRGVISLGFTPTSSAQGSSQFIGKVQPLITGPNASCLGPFSADIIAAASTACTSSFQKARVVPAYFTTAEQIGCQVLQDMNTLAGVASCAGAAIIAVGGCAAGAATGPGDGVICPVLLTTDAATLGATCVTFLAGAFSDYLTNSSLPSIAISAGSGDVELAGLSFSCGEVTQNFRFTGAPIQGASWNGSAELSARPGTTVTFTLKVDNSFRDPLPNSPVYFSSSSPGLFAAVEPGGAGVAITSATQVFDTNAQGEIPISFTAPDTASASQQIGLTASDRGSNEAEVFWMTPLEQLEQNLRSTPGCNYSTLHPAGYDMTDCSSGVSLTGKSITVETSGFRPKSVCTVSIHSVPTVLARVVSASSGHVGLRIMPSMGLDPGHHIVTIAGTSRSGSPLLAVAFFYLRASRPTVAWRRWVLVGLGVALAGVVAALRTRRRATTK